MRSSTSLTCRSHRHFGGVALHNCALRIIGHGGEYVDGEPVGARHVHRDEFHIAIHQAGNKMHAPRQPVELGYHQHGAALTAFREGGGELGPVILAPAPPLPRTARRGRPCRS